MNQTNSSPINPYMFRAFAKAGLVTRDHRLERLKDRVKGKRRYLAHLERRTGNPRCPEKVKAELAPEIRRIEREIEKLEIKIADLEREGGIRND